MPKLVPRFAIRAGRYFEGAWLGGASLLAGSRRIPSLSVVILIYLYVSRFLHDAVLVPIVAIAFCLQDVTLDRSGLRLLFALVVLSFLQGLLLDGHIEQPPQILHATYILLIALAVEDSRFDAGILLRFCIVSTAWNLLWLGLGLLTPLSSVAFWGEGVSTPRFQSTLPEPSFVGIYSAFNAFVLLRRKKPIWACANLIPLLASFSLAGGACLAILSLVHARRYWKQITVGLVVLGGLAIATYLVVPELVTGLVLDRLTNASEGGGDESFVLRLVAPFDLIKATLSGPPLQALLGLGVGNVEHYIHVEQVALPSHWRANGERTEQPDSVIGFVIAAFGVVGVVLLLLLASWIIKQKPRRPEFGMVQLMLGFMAIFTGLFFSLHFWAWYYLLRHEKGERENTAIGAEASVSAR